MIDFKKVASLAGKAAEAASKTTELLQIDNVTLPRLYAEIGKWIVQHKKLPPDLAQHREQILLLESQQSQSQSVATSHSPASITEKAKHLASQAGQAAASAALSAKIRSAHVSLGQYAWSKYGEKVLPKPIAKEFMDVMARRQSLKNSSAPSVGEESPSQSPKSARPAKNRSQARKSGGTRKRVALAVAGVGMLIGGVVVGWRLLSSPTGALGRQAANSAGAKQKSPVSPKPPVSPSKQPPSFLSDRHDGALTLMFPGTIPPLGKPGKTCRNIVLRGGKLLTVFDSGGIEVECVVRSSDGVELSRQTVSGSLASGSGLNPLVACGEGAALVVKRGQRFSCVVLGGNGKTLWETEPLSEVYAIAALGEGEILVSANLVNAPSASNGDSPFYALHRWDAKGKRSWGYEGGGPFLGSIGKGLLEVYESTNTQLMVAADGVVAVTVNGSGPTPSPRVAVSTNAEGQTLAFIPRLPRTPKSVGKPKPPMLRGVLRDGRIVAQDPDDTDTLLVYGAEGKELIRKRMGICMQARSCRNSDDAFVALAAGDDTRLVRLRPDGSEAWQVSLREAIPNVSGQDLRAFLSDTLLELPKGGLLWTCRNYAIVVDRNGKVVACGRARDMGAQADVSTDGKVLWPSVEGPCLVGELATWPAS